MPEPRIQEMQHRMLAAADVEIDSARFASAHPILLWLLAHEPFVVLRIAEPQVVPARAGPLRHCVRFAQILSLSLLIFFLSHAGRARGSGRFVTNPIFRFRQRRLAGSRRSEILEGGGLQRQFRFRQRFMFAIAPDDRERFAPIALPRKKPVVQLVSNVAQPMPVLLKPIDDSCRRLNG